MANFYMSNIAVFVLNTVQWSVAGLSRAHLIDKYKRSDGVKSNPILIQS